MAIRIYFSNIFNVNPEDVETYGAFNISLINDLPLFIDPFLIFGSKKTEYQQLHQDILTYLAFLKDKSTDLVIGEEEILAWYSFSEVRQNWFGYSVSGNSGRGLGPVFGRNFSSAINIVFADLGKEQVTVSSHLEKAALLQIGVGRDNISDFTTNLIKSYLLRYTETFAKKYIDPRLLKLVKVDKVYFAYDLERWMPKSFLLPFWNNDYVLLTPRDILTKDDNWINSKDMVDDFNQICNTIQNKQLRFEIDNYFRKQLPIRKKNKSYSQKDFKVAAKTTIKQFPEIINYYVRSKENNIEGAKNVSEQKVEEVEKQFVKELTLFADKLLKETDFYNDYDGSFGQSLARVKFLKQVIENNDGYRLFYSKGKPVKREEDLQIIYRLTWFATDYDVNREVNNGRGSVDFKISKGISDKTLVEFKLASNSKLKQNLQNQVEIYEKANDTKQSIKVILYFDINEYHHVLGLLKTLKLENKEDIILIDAGRKTSASNVKSVS